jgi:hypothetical protein
MGIGTVSTLYRLPECQILQRNLWQLKNANLLTWNS